MDDYSYGESSQIFLSYTKLPDWIFLNYRFVHTAPVQKPLSLACIPGLLLTCSASDPSLCTSPVSPFSNLCDTVMDYQNEPSVYIVLVY